MTSATMIAAVVETAGAPFQLARVARPVPAAGQVLVRIAASGVAPLDTKIRAGAAGHARQPLPAILGTELAGVVEAVGPGATAFRPGDEVYGLTGGGGGLPGSLAEYAAVDADLLAPRPRNLTMRDAAALPLNVITAWEGLVDRAAVQPGQTVLVQGAGGVGQIAIQIARARGAVVFAVDSAAKADMIRELGATPIDRATPVDDYVRGHTGGRGFDLVYDTVGGVALDASFLAVRRFGHVVSCLGWGSHALAPLSFRAATYSGVFTLLPLLSGEGRAHHGEILREAARLVEAGALRPELVAQRFRLDAVDEAYRSIQGGPATGKTVIDLVG